MAKDSRGATPSGALTRHPADWFSEELYVASWRQNNQPVGPGLIYVAIGVFNQDPQGRVMRIYGVTVDSEGGGGLQIFYTNDTFGSEVGTVTNIRPDRGSPNIIIVQEHQQTAAGNPNPFDFGDPVGQLGNAGFDSNSFFSPFPLFIVPVNYGIVATNPLSSFENGITWWFQLSNS